MSIHGEQSDLLKPFSDSFYASPLPLDIAKIRWHREINIERLFQTLTPIGTYVQ